MVLDSLARTLQLDEPERIHLFDLAKAAAPSQGLRDAPGAGGSSPEHRTDPGGIDRHAGICPERPMDIMAANRLCLTLYTGILSPDTLPQNLARFMFLDPRSQDFFR